MTLMYWREYRTQFHNAGSYGISEVTVCRTINKVEEALVRSGEFRLPGKKVLQPSDTIIESEFLNTLPMETSLEHTYYPPSIPAGRFSREHNYPIYFRKAQNETIPVSKQYVFNAGEIGLDERETDYFIVDSFTTDKFKIPIPVPICR